MKRQYSYTAKRAEKDLAQVTAELTKVARAEINRARQTVHELFVKAQDQGEDIAESLMAEGDRLHAQLTQFADSSLRAYYTYVVENTNAGEFEKYELERTCKFRGFTRYEDESGSLIDGETEQKAMDSLKRIADFFVSNWNFQLELIIQSAERGHKRQLEEDKKGNDITEDEVRETLRFWSGSLHIEVSITETETETETVESLTVTETETETETVEYDIEPWAREIEEDEYGWSPTHSDDIEAMYSRLTRVVNTASMEHWLYPEVDCEEGLTEQVTEARSGGLFLGLLTPWMGAYITGNTC